MARFQRGFIRLDSFHTIYQYIIHLLIFLILFRFSVKSLYCQKPTSGFLAIAGVVILYFISPNVLKMIDIVIFFLAMGVIVFSKEYRQAKKKLKNQSNFDREDLC